MRLALILAFPVLLGAAQPPGEGTEQKVSGKALPPAVTEAMRNYIKTDAAGATVRGYSKEAEEGKTFYGVELRINGKTRDVTFDPEGKLISVEQEVEMGSVPAPVQDALKKAAGKRRITLVEKIEKLGATYYEAHVKKGLFGEDEVKVDAAGKPVS